MILRDESNEKQQAYNPYLPSWEFIPDGEPYVFGNRIYIYGSHDYYNGHVFCLGDYVCWSADVKDLGNWRYEGVIYKKTDDPINPEGKMCLYAPDVTVGEDGRYYLYYVLDKAPVVSVAVCDTPAGKYEFYGYVHYRDGRRLGENDGTEQQFDPAVLTENGKTYLYTGGVCFAGETVKHGAMVTVLGKDMLTIETEPKFVIPSAKVSNGTGFEAHEFFEASSIRKRGDDYYFIYSSVVMHELCYAKSKSPTEGFSYGGVVVSNCDLHIDSYKPAQMPAAYGYNNHGSIVEINGEWFVFYHRHTNGTGFSRQDCAERIHFREDGSICQAELTSCGLNGGPLAGTGRYATYIACNLFTEKESIYVGGDEYPKIIMDGREGDEIDGYVTNVGNTATIGFKYFRVKEVKEIEIITRGYAKGVFEIRGKWDGPILASIPIEYTNIWEKYNSEIHFNEEISAIYFTFRGEGRADFQSFTLG